MAKRRVRKSSGLKIIGLLAAVAALVYLSYSVWYTLKVKPEQGLTFCLQAGQQKTIEYITESGEKFSQTVGGDREACFWTAHIHATMDLTYCGSQLELPKDKGDLRGPHTHKELNKMHSPHSPQKVDQASKQFIDPTPLTVGGFLDAMEIDTKTACPGKKESAASVAVNNTGKDLDYLWQDGDIIQIKYE